MNYSVRVGREEFSSSQYYKSRSAFRQFSRSQQGPPVSQDLHVNKHVLTYKARQVPRAALG